MQIKLPSEILNYNMNIYNLFRYRFIGPFIWIVCGMFNMELSTMRTRIFANRMSLVRCLKI